MQFVSAGRAARLISRLFRICGLMLGGLRFFHRFHFFFFFPVAGLSVQFRRLLLLASLVPAHVSEYCLNAHQPGVEEMNLQFKTYSAFAEKKNLAPSIYLK